MVAPAIIGGIVVVLLGLSAYATRRQKARLAAGGRVYETYHPSTDASTSYQAIRDRSGRGPL